MLDKILRRLGYQKIAKRSMTGFAAARTDRLVSSWNPANLSMDAVLRTQLPRIRARSRDLSINNPYIKKFIGMVAVNVLGPGGISFQSKLKFKNGSLDERSNIAIETAWKEWGRRRHSPDVNRETLLGPPSGPLPADGGAGRRNLHPPGAKLRKRAQVFPPAHRGRQRR